MIRRGPTFPTAVATLAGLSALAFAYEALASPVARSDVIAAWALVPYDLTNGVQLQGPPTWLTPLTALFLHASVAHIAFNLLFLAAFGPAIESLTGSGRFALLYLACGVLGNLAQVSVDPGSHVPEIGASGAIAGILGAYILRFPHAPSFLGLPAYVVIGVWACFQFVHGLGTLATNVLSEQGGGTAYFAHIGGFLAGVFATRVTAREMPSLRRSVRHDE